MTLEELCNCYHADPLACRAEDLADLKQITIATDMPATMRAARYMEQVQNPYLFRVDQTIVKVIFSGKRDLSSALTDLLMQNEKQRSSHP